MIDESVLREIRRNAAIAAAQVFAILLVCAIVAKSVIY